MKSFKIYKPVKRRYCPGVVLCTKFARNAGLGSTEFLQQSMILHIIQQAHRCLLLYDPDKAVFFCKNFVQQSRVIALRGMVDSTDAFTALGPGLCWGALLKQVPQCNAQRSGHQLICLVFYIIQSWTAFLTRRLHYNLANCSDPAKGQLLPPDGSRRQQQATKFLMLPHISL